MTYKPMQIKAAKDRFQLHGTAFSYQVTDDQAIEFLDFYFSEGDLGRCGYDVEKQKMKEILGIT